MADIYVSGVRLTEEQAAWLRWYMDNTDRDKGHDLIEGILEAVWGALPVGSSEEDPADRVIADGETGYAGYATEAEAVAAQIARAVYDALPALPAGSSEEDQP